MKLRILALMPLYRLTAPRSKRQESSENSAEKAKKDSEPHHLE